MGSGHFLYSVLIMAAFTIPKQIIKKVCASWQQFDCLGVVNCTRQDDSAIWLRVLPFLPVLRRPSRPERNHSILWRLCSLVNYCIKCLERILNFWGHLLVQYALITCAKSKKMTPVCSPLNAWGATGRVCNLQRCLIAQQELKGLCQARTSQSSLWTILFSSLT